MARTVYKLIFKMNQRFLKQAFILVTSTLALYEVNNAHLNKKKRPKKLKWFYLQKPCCSEPLFSLYVNHRLPLFMRGHVDCSMSDGQEKRWKFYA
jgi:hypothetical protein